MVVTIIMAKDTAIKPPPKDLMLQFHQPHDIMQSGVEVFEPTIPGRPGGQARRFMRHDKPFDRPRCSCENRPMRHGDPLHMPSMELTTPRLYMQALRRIMANFSVMERSHATAPTQKAQAHG